MRTKSIRDLYNELVSYEYTNPRIIVQKLNEFLQNPDEYTGDPNIWHNLGMRAARVEHHKAELLIAQAGQREWPEDVDLICDELQLRYTTSFDLDEAQKVWEKLESIKGSRRTSEWRYWSFGATYHAKFLRDPNKGLELLDQGLRHVRPENMHNIIKAYRHVLIDSIPHELLEDDDSLREYHKRLFKLLESKYKLGMSLGVENGHNLAIELAKLYQERSYQLTDTIDKPTDATDYLKKASDVLDQAEGMYTGIGGSNYLISAIYVAKIRVLMAQRKYGEALKLLGSLSDREIQKDQSLLIMRNLATLMVGEQLPSESIASKDETNVDERVQRELSKVLTNDELLYRVARNDEPILRTMFTVMQRIIEESESAEG